jgi:hypothetical protein
MMLIWRKFIVYCQGRSLTVPVLAAIGHLQSDQDKLFRYLCLFVLAKRVAGLSTLWL